MIRSNKLLIKNIKLHLKTLQLYYYYHATIVTRRIKKNASNKPSNQLQFLSSTQAARGTKKFDDNSFANLKKNETEARNNSRKTEINWIKETIKQQQKKRYLFEQEKEMFRFSYNKILPFWGDQN